MIIRMFEYDSQIALDGGEINDHVLTVAFPNSAVLYLRHTTGTPDEMTIRIQTPASEISYQIPILKVQNYTIEEIFEKQLYFLIPFYIFCYEKSLKEYNSDNGKLRELEKIYLEIRKRLETLCLHGSLGEYEKCAIIDLSKKVLDNIAAKYDNVRKGVRKVMGGKILDHEAKAILNKGKKEGYDQGVRQGYDQGKTDGINQGYDQGKTDGINQTYIGLIHDGLLSIAEAASRLGMKESELQKLL